MCGGTPSSRPVLRDDGEVRACSGGLEHAIELEPVVPSLQSCAAQILYSARRYDEAIRQGYATLAMAPELYGLLGWIGAACLKKGNLAAALSTFTKALEHIPEDPRLQALHGTARAAAGDTEGANEVLQKLEALSQRSYVDQYFPAWLFAAMGNPAGAIASLEKAYEEHSNWMPWLGVDPLMDAIRAEPGYAALIDRLGYRPPH